MQTQTFKPQVFRVTTESGGNTFSWDLLTLDGQAPNDTVYFLHKNDAPSYDQGIEIAAAIENEEFEVRSISDEDVILNYSIDITIFDGTGGAYDEIINRLNELQEEY